MPFPFSSLEQLPASELNTELRRVIDVDQVAGETINGATLPVPCYLLASDNEWYASDANDDGKNHVDGFAITNGTDGNPITIQFSGVVAGFSGLTPGAVYYLQDAVGTIGTTPGTVSQPVGIAISATELLITKDMKIKKGTGSDQSGSVTTGTDSDSEVITLGWRPKLVLLYGQAEGHCSASNNDVCCGLVIFNKDGGLGIGGSGNNATVALRTAITASATHDIFARITTTISITDMSATGFTIYTFYQGGGNGSDSSGNANNINWIAIG